MGFRSTAVLAVVLALAAACAAPEPSPTSTDSLSVAAATAEQLPVTVASLDLAAPLFVTVSADAFAFVGSLRDIEHVEHTTRSSIARDVPSSVPVVDSGNARHRSTASNSGHFARSDRSTRS